MVLVLLMLPPFEVSGGGGLVSRRGDVLWWLGGSDMAGAATAVSTRRGVGVVVVDLKNIL